MPKINLISASRERPSRMAKTILKWYNCSSDPSNIEFIISIDNSDPCLEKYKKIIKNNTKTENDIKIRLLVNDNKNTVQAINSAKDYINGDIIFIISDDTDCFDGWDTEIINVCPKGGYYIIKTNDGMGKDLITMPIFSREYLDSKDYIYYPEYEHMFCDTDLTCVSYLEGSVIEANDITFNHLHYTRGYHKKDNNDLKNQLTFYTGMEIFKNRLSINFGVSEDYTKGEIPKNIIDFVNSY